MKFWQFMLVFWFGFVSCVLVYSISLSGDFEFPAGFNFNSNVVSPSDFITEEDIIVQHDRIILIVSEASISRYADSGSMEPLFDSDSNGIRVVPKSSDEISVGDIISYKKNGRLIVHRVIMKGVDSDGVYFVVAGDNNEYLDGMVRFSDIKYKTIGILY